MSNLGVRLLGMLEGVGIALDSLRSNKVRAALTILGVAVGVFVVVVISAAIHGINTSVARDFERAGPKTFFLNRFPITFVLDSTRSLYRTSLFIPSCAAAARIDGSAPTALASA